jgi:hypothetical protein
MAHPSRFLVDAIKTTARNLETSSKYMWGHMGSCNCGNLAQELSNYTKEDIHNFARQGRGDWREQLEEYCPTSQMPIDMLIASMLQKGLTTSDLQHLEWLSDPKVKANMPFERRNELKHNVKEDVVYYLNTWANMLEDELLEDIKIDLEKIIEKKEVLEMIS